MAKKRKSKKPDLTTSQHDKHGRGTAEDGPEEPDCACRDTAEEKACARAGCGFCLASVEHKAKPPHHCDDVADDPTTPEALRVWLNRAREPAHGLTNKEPWPQCYADFEGKTVRLSMASRLGSVGWTSDLTQEVGYQNRGWLEQLSNFRATP